MTHYDPRPIDTSGITLPDDLIALTERLAKSTHDHWAAQRLQDGWVFGDKRDDDAKTHPSLIPYDDLPDSEKHYDQLTAMETLKAVLALGYDIRKKE